jgi:hypothetical protein
VPETQVTADISEDRNQQVTQVSISSITDSQMATCSNSTYDPKTAIYNIEVGLKKEVLSTDSGIQDISSGSDLVFLLERLENCLTRAHDLTI